ncbi:MAG: sulfate ABC transporter permease subunit, partial [Actinomycetota bacterium]|nr:sulfate ABC transporter permease subunit [Actinomycetota bacterium]
PPLMATMSASGPPSAFGRRASRAGLVIVGLLYVAVLLLAPLAGIVWSTLRDGVGVVTETLGQHDVRHAFWLTAVITAITVVVTTVLGVVVSWVLTRDRFIGRRLVDAVVDLPLAVSPVIVGLTAILLFGRGGWFEPFLTAQGIQILFALPSMILVTIFICIPFVVREVAPVLEELGTEEEEAALTLGASSLQTFFKVTLPGIKWGLLYGIALTTARAMGEIGAVLIVSGSIQGQTETATLFIFRALEERQDTQALVVALALAGISILILVAIELAKRRQPSRRSEIS